MNKLYGFLGLCAKSGRLTTGADACERLIRSRGAKVALIDAGAGPNTRKALENACNTYNVPLIFISESELGRALGKPGRMAMATSDESFAKRIIELYRESSGGVLIK